MKHFHLDEFAQMDTFFHRIDPRAKTVTTLVFIFLAAGVKTPALLFATAFFWILLLIFAQIPLSYIFSRITWVIPFAGIMILFFPFIKPGETLFHVNLWVVTLTATKEGAREAVMLFGRVLASILAVLFLTLTTRFNYLLKALAELRVPAVFLQLLEFTVRYIFVALDELKRMRRARKARAFVAGKNIWHLHTLRTLGQLVGSLFIRAYERGERVYLVMLSRGYTGKMKTLHDFRMMPKDFIWTVLLLGAGIVLVILDRRGL
ncbi:cobalt ECF transporter T component CbiQ [Thermincola potens]|uniref:Cobalt ABC transporter, inner membrane subunit CbiQ n=1 Tax=Thermincola potens (strain JR) TaxID=635013 RepID=D5XA18_THEPJ|nr:cobalt ECF transporter T component CbiQ [Thermincola potens]ADG83151.1 cobalt ABC transporter, inner membrane subunit CbiQ [Thermincola potens JR]